VLCRFASCLNALLADDSKELARVGPGQCFGELALMSGDLRAANVMALDNSVVRASCCFSLFPLFFKLHNARLLLQPAGAVVDR
jgi:hypothetical protein